MTVFAPLAATALAIALTWRRWVEPRDLLVCAAMYVVTILGITMGFHRLFTHKSFKCGAALRACLGIAGSRASQGPLFFWAACHRRHHQHSDEADDPHSPHAHGGGWRGVLGGCWHAHVGWMLTHNPQNYFRLVNDLVRDPVVMAVHRFYFLWVIAGLALPGVATALIAGDASAFWSGVLWGGLVRMFVVHHETWSVNSGCHLFGASAFETEDESRNNAAVAIPHARRRLAQQPPCLPVVGAPWVALVADRSVLFGAARAEGAAVGVGYSHALAQRAGLVRGVGRLGAGDADGVSEGDPIRGRAESFSPIFHGSREGC